MKLLPASVVIVVFSTLLFAVNDSNLPETITDVATIVDKANIMAYYQGKDGEILCLFSKTC